MWGEKNNQNPNSIIWPERTEPNKLFQSHKSLSPIKEESMFLKIGILALQ